MHATVKAHGEKESHEPFETEYVVSNASILASQQVRKQSKLKVNVDV